MKGKVELEDLEQSAKRGSPEEDGLMPCPYFAEVAVKLISDKTFLIIMRVKVKVGGQDLVEFFYEVPFQQGQRELSTVCA